VARARGLDPMPRSGEDRLGVDSEIQSERTVAYDCDLVEPSEMNLQPQKKKSQNAKRKKTGRGQWDSHIWKYTSTRSFASLEAGGMRTSCLSTEAKSGSRGVHVLCSQVVGLQVAL
jgi:hypothetical protein